MVVREDDAAAVVKRCVEQDRAERKIGSAGVAVMTGEVNAARLIVEVGDEQAFARRVDRRETFFEKPACLLLAGERDGGRGWPGFHPAML